MVNKVRVTIAGAPYAIATTDSEKYIASLAKRLDEDITKLLDTNENLSVTKAAVFCAMDYLDEYKKSTGSAENMRSQIQLFGKTEDVLFRICGGDGIRCARDVDPYLVYHGVFPFLSCICTAQGRFFCILPRFGTVPGNVSAFKNVSAEFPVPLLPELLPEKRFAVQFYLLL